LHFIAGQVATSIGSPRYDETRTLLECFHIRPAHRPDPGALGFLQAFINRCVELALARRDTVRRPARGSCMLLSQRLSTDYTRVSFGLI